jgi:hypothetical protein
MAEEVVLRIGEPEKVLLRVVAEKGIDAYSAAVKWCNDMGLSAGDIMVVSTPFTEQEMARGIVGYEDAPVWNLAESRLPPMKRQAVEPR